MRCSRGAIFDVALDIRRGSPTYGKWEGYELTPENGHQPFVPIGFAHGRNFVKTMLRLSETRNVITVVDDQVGGPTFARDVANTCLSIAEQLMKDPTKSGIYHYSGQPDVSWCQFPNAIFKKRGRNTIASPISTIDYPTPTIRPLNSRLNCALT